MSESRLFRLVFEDEAAGRTERNWALSVGFPYAILNICVFARPERQVLIETAIAVSVTICSYNIWYCFKGSASRINKLDSDDGDSDKLTTDSGKKPNGIQE